MELKRGKRKHKGAHSSGRKLGKYKVPSRGSKYFGTGKSHKM